MVRSKNPPQLRQAEADYTPLCLKCSGEGGYWWARQKFDHRKRDANTMRWTWLSGSVYLGSWRLRNEANTPNERETTQSKTRKKGA